MPKKHGCGGTELEPFPLGQDGELASDVGQEHGFDFFLVHMVEKGRLYAFHASRFQLSSPPHSKVMPIFVPKIGFFKKVANFFCKIYITGARPKF